MPPPVHRKKPFSTKQKKRQLQERRDKRRDDDEFSPTLRGVRGASRVRVAAGTSRHCPPRGCRERGPFIASDQSREHTESSDDHSSEWEVLQVHSQPNHGKKLYDPNRYRLHFLRETRDEIESRKATAYQPLHPVPEAALEMDIEVVHRPGTVLDMPRRPPWNYSMSKEQLFQQEEKYFQGYLESIFEAHSPAELSYIELNLETWRQLWRVVEMADIVLLITDIRHPVLHFSPALYHYVTAELKKPLVLILNKIDMAPAALVVAWRHYFQSKFPDVHMIAFTSFPRDQVDLTQQTGKLLLHKKRRKGAFTAIGPRELLKACVDIVGGKVDLSSWQAKIEEDMLKDTSEEEVSKHPVNIEELDTSFREHETYKDGVLTIGCCGYPNVGKSSLINGLMGQKVVSVSRTPGHTKHFQTIYLTPTVRLADCPGLVFPSLIPKPMQILAGIYPIAQVREPYTAIAYLAERVALTSLLALRHPECDVRRPDLKDTPGRAWSAMDICEAWASKRGFMTARAARADTYRAANSLLRLAMEGRIILCLRPTGYTALKAMWAAHADTEAMAALQARHMSQLTIAESADEDSDDPDDLIESSSYHDDLDEEDESPVSTTNPYALLSSDD